MERKRFLKWAGFAILTPSYLLQACGDKIVPGEQAAEKTYTCPMHPQIVQTKPGSCPICGMDLVPFDKNNKEASLTLNKDQQLLANITTLTIGRGAMETTTRLNGRLVVNPANTVYVSSRVAGRLDMLAVRETGARVKKGQLLYKIYSEQLLALQKEYQLAAAQAGSFPGDHRFRQIEEAARQKLLLYGQSAAQVDQLRTTDRDDPNVYYYAPQAGTVAELSVAEGQYVEEGTSLLKLEDYRQLWVEIDLYPMEAKLVQQGQFLVIEVAGETNRRQTVKIEFIQPSLSSGTQLLTIRGTVSNITGTWQPGMPVQALLNKGAATPVLTVPVNAVVRDGKSAHVWIRVTEEKFLPRAVALGAENADEVEITSGLEEGDKVVISGAYLLYSEYILKKGKHPIQKV